jgi:putative tryptophan/tyrosine transport system substrate-binding protein
MRRREFIVTLLLAATLRPAQAQQPTKIYRIAVVNPSRPAALLTETGGLPTYEAFFKELRRLGYIEGQNLVVERHSGEGRAEHAELAREVVRSNPDLIFTLSARLVQHFKAATTIIPIIAYTSDPIAYGLATSLARPGGNVTGVVADVGEEFWDKQLELLREVVPGAFKVAYLTPRAVWDLPMGTVARNTAQRVGIELIGTFLKGRIQEAEYRRVFAMMAQERPDALIVNDTPENYAYQGLITELANNARLPTYPNRSFVNIGGLMAYGPNTLDLFRHAAGQIDQILKGAKPGDIPFYQPTKFELVINLKTSRALGLNVPPSLLARADEVIE